MVNFEPGVKDDFSVSDRGSSQVALAVLWLLNYYLYHYNGSSIKKKRVKGLAKYVRCNKVSLYRGPFPYILLLRGVKKIIRYTEDFVIKRFIISRFHCIYSHGRAVTKISCCRVYATSRRGIKNLGNSSGSIFLLCPIKGVGSHAYMSQGEN